MKKLIIVLVLFLAPALVRAGAEGHGGAGVVKNGKFMTFYSAGLYVEPDNGGSSVSIPSLDRLITYVMNLNYIGDGTKAKLLGAIVPSETRKYFIASPEQLTSQIKNRLLAEFSRITNVDTSNLNLFALTDTTTQTTFLLPEFAKLSPDDQLAALFHENYWILNRDAPYNNVVSAEMAFEAALEAPNNPANVYDFVRYVGTPEEVAGCLVKWDFADGALDGLLHNGDQMTLLDLFGSDFIACEMQYASPPGKKGCVMGRGFHPTEPICHDSGEDGIQEVCFPKLLKRMYELKIQHPKSMVLRKIFENLGDGTSSYLPLFDNTREDYWLSHYMNWDEASRCTIFLSSEDVHCQYGSGKSIEFGINLR